MRAKIKARQFALLVLALGSVQSGRAYAGFHEIYKGVRASGMGGAYVAIADDEQAIFLNPAAMAGTKGFKVNYAAVDVETSWDTIMTGLEGLTAFSDFSAETLNEFMGKNLYTHVQGAPSIMVPNFGLAILLDHQVSFTEQNMANPEVTLGLQSTNGIQTAFGISVLGRKAKRSDLRVGVGVKFLWRRGGYHTLGFLELLELSQNTNYWKEITGSYGFGVGVDLGTQYLFKVNDNLTLSSGLVMNDVGDTAFTSIADPQKSNLTWGLGATYKFSRYALTVAYDYRHILQDTEFKMRNHLGVELALPFISVYGGVYQASLSYGASFDVWLLRVTASSYAEEQGVYAGQNPERRYALRLALKFGM